MLFTGAGIVAIYDIQSLKGSIQTAQKLPLFISRASLEIEILIVKLKNLENSWFATKDPAQHKTLLAEIANNEKKVVLLLGSIVKKTEPGHIRILTVKTLDDFIVSCTFRKTILGVTEDNTSSGDVLVARAKEAALYHQIEIQLDQIGENANKQGTLLLKETTKSSQRKEVIFISVFILAILLGTILSLASSKSMSRRLISISDATTRMAQGDLKQSIEIRKNDELSKVARNFNIMAVEIYNLYHSLEEKVQERTKELNEANETLAKMKNELEIKVTERTTDMEAKVQELNKSQKALLYMVEDLNRTSRKLKDTQEELVRKERLAILGEFSGNISHELRNPLGVIDSSIYFLKMKLQDKDEKTLQHLERISNSVKTSISIIENLLNLTRMNKPVLTSFNCLSLIRECLNSCTIPPKVKVINDFTDEPLMILAEKVQFQMAVSNLVKNAFSAMNENGTLTIKVHRNTREQAEVSFTDSGIGITPANMDKIFQPLFTTKSKGFGLGLSITKMVVENHGGKIFVESAPGKGSRFVLLFPLISDGKEINNDFAETKT